MKINKIHIGAFGGLKDYVLDLNDGLNIIYGDNENGKSTVMAFIKAMFYGTGKKTQTLENSPRVKYAPWSGDRMCGRIYFENNNKRYCLEREFRGSNATDKITLTDTDSGISESVSSDIGSRFFGVGVEAFERCMFIGILPLAGSADGMGQIDSKLSNLAATGDEDTSFKEIEGRISDAKEKIISKSGRTGSFVKGSQELSSLKEKLAENEAAAAQKQKLNMEIAGRKAQAAVLIKEYEGLKKIYESKDDIKNAQKLREYLDLKAQLDQLNQELTAADGTLINDMLIKKVDFCLQKTSSLKEKTEKIGEEIQSISDAINLSSAQNLEQTKAELQEIKEKTSRLESEKEEIDKKLQNIQQEITHSKAQVAAAENSKKPVNPMLLAAAIVLCALGGGLFAFIKLAGIISIVAGVVLLVMSFIVRPKNKALLLKAQTEFTALQATEAAVRNERVLKSEEINNLSGRSNLLASALNTDAAIKAQRESDLNAKRQELKEEEEKLSAAQKDLDEVCSKLDSGEDLNLFLSRVQQSVDEQKTVKLKLNFLCNDLGNISYDEARQKLQALEEKSEQTSVDFDEIKLRLDQITDELSTIKTEITQRDTELKTAFRSFENPEDLKREISIFEEELKTQKDFCDAAEIALSVLTESNNEMRRSYGRVLEDKALGIFSKLTLGRYSAFSVSKEMEIQIEQTGTFGKKEIGYLSQGAADQAYLSLRLAVTELISPDEPLPVILDDALSQYDDTRTREALDFLKEYSQNSQAVLFTCHSSICTMANELGIICRNLHN